MCSKRLPQCLLLFLSEQLRDCELAPGVNRDLARRVRNVNGITQHKQVLRNDIKLAAKLIHALDDRERLWSLKPREEMNTLEVFSLHRLRLIKSQSKPFKIVSIIDRFSIFPIFLIS